MHGGRLMAVLDPIDPAYLLDDGLTAFAPPGAGVQVGYGQVAGVARIFDTQAGTDPWRGLLAVDTKALNTASGNTYQVWVESSTTPDFSAGKRDVVKINVGAILPVPSLAKFTTVYAGTRYRYLRAKFVTDGPSKSIRARIFLFPATGADEWDATALYQAMGLELQNLNNVTTGLAAWANGVVNGGPNGDGKYPVVDYNGAVHNMPCIAQMLFEAGSGGGLSQGNIDGLPGFSDHTTSPTVPVTYPLAGGGRALAKADLFGLMAAHRQDVTMQSDLSGISAVFGLTISGLERQIGVNAIVQVFGGIIDPRKPPYNCKMDFRDYRAFTSSAGSSVIESADANVVTAADIGKEFWLSNVGTNGCHYGWIGQIVDSRHFRLYTDATLSTPLNAPSSQTNLDGMWGTDDTVGIQRAFDDAEPPDHYSRGKVVVMTGIAIVSAVRFGSIAIYGFASQTCGFAQRPENSSTTSPMVADKITGVYASKRPHHYSLINLSFFGQKYCQFYTSFRRCFEIRGGNFGAFWEGAPYGHIENLIFIEAQWEGASLQQAFAGKAYGLQAFYNSWCGIRCGLWDLNGHSWHCEANGHAGILSHMAGANLTNVKCSYNGGSASGTFIHENSANYTELGVGNSVTNIRVQESWGHGICISNTDPLFITNNAASKNKFYLAAFDDVGNMGPGHGVRPGSLPPVRAMIYIKGSTANDNVLDLVTGTYGISVSGAPPENNATHGYFDTGNPARNIVHLRTPGTTNNPADWYAGRTTPLPAIPAGTGAYAPGPWGTDSSTSIGTRNPEITVNGASVP
ncbi:hypothetical protein AEAC466_17415 [Asticcacaulis sp. AC466]|uniref:hypothetical protein n=1 Tax=Asticcacaulis sp. AC466 TaxID=1282362 RepID=UPI0003C40351|nr:hypothetical protein [Asticcacaulis sp. AC466]ESQ82402.1 hypothetical protein AEAC466_17415 [Asticcacaulis sp. AC466]